jgi:2-keto-3-deoxy-6-phosphogluconate aldolase
MKQSLAFVRPGLILSVWRHGGPLIEITLTRRHAFTLLRDLAAGLADNEP